MSSQNSRCYWKTKDWNLLVFWSLPPSAHKPSIHLDSHSWKRCTFIRCSASLWSQPHCLCPSYWTGIPITATIRNGSIECYRMFYSFWDPPSVTGIFSSDNPQTQVLQQPQSQGAHHPEEQERFKERKLSHRGMSQLIKGGNSMFLTAAEKETLSIIKIFTSLPSFPHPV